MERCPSVLVKFTKYFVHLLQVQEVMQPMQQVMSDAESILATEPRVGFNIGQAKEELIKVNVRILSITFYTTDFLFCIKRVLTRVSFFVPCQTEND